MTDPKVEEIRARLDQFLPLSDMQGRYLLTKLDEAEGENAEIIAANKALAEQLDRQQEKFGVEVEEHHGDLRLGWDFEERALAAEERERVLLEGIRETVASMDASRRNGTIYTHGHVRAALSRLLPSTPKDADRG
jgi:hypothetical protein